MFTICSGRSEEMAEVVFLKKPDAERAMQRYNNVSLDGKQMSIELVAPTLGGRVVETLTSGLRHGLVQYQTQSTISGQS